MTSLVSKTSKLSKSAAIKAKLDYPVIDTDLHTIEFAPLLEDYIAKHGGASSVDQFRAAINRGFGYLSNEWYDLSPEERSRRRSVRPPWWALPTKNTLDLATVSLPGLLYERIAESGTDYAVLFPNVSTFATHIGNRDLRRALVRAVNEYHADVYRPYADRLTPVAAIPLATPEEGIEELEFAINTLGLKVALIPGNLRRPVKSVAEKYPAREHPDVARYANWLENFFAGKNPAFFAGTQVERSSRKEQLESRGAAAPCMSAHHDHTPQPPRARPHRGISTRRFKYLDPASAHVAGRREGRL